MRTSVDIVTNPTRTTSHPKVARSSLQIGDLFMGKEGGHVMMNTGCRTAPPSNRKVSYSVGEHRGEVDLYKSQGTTANGKDVIGWQSIVVSGIVPYGEDGAHFTTNGDRLVYHVGTADIVLNQ